MYKKFLQNVIALDSVAELVVAKLENGISNFVAGKSCDATLQVLKWTHLPFIIQSWDEEYMSINWDYPEVINRNDCDPKKKNFRCEVKIISHVSQFFHNSS